MNGILNQDGIPAAGEGGIDLVELVSYFWSRKFAILAVMLAAVALASIYLHIATYRYTAELRVSPAQPSSLSGGRLSQLSGLASIAGLSLPGDSSGFSFALYQEGLTSMEVATELAKDRQLMRRLFVEEWDPGVQAFVEPESAVGGIVSGVKAVLGVPAIRWSAPDALRLRKLIEEDVRVSEDVRSPVIVLSYDNPDPALAAEVVQKLHLATDHVLKRKARERADQHVAFLNNELLTASVVEHRESLAKALTEQVMQQMTASSSLAYAAEQFGVPIVSTQPTSPKAVM